MPVHPEMIGGEHVYHPVVQGAVDAMGEHAWRELPRETQERIRLEVIEREREKSRDAYRKYIS